MRLLIVTPTYEPAWRFGGTVASNSTLARELVKCGVEVTVYTTSASGEEHFLDVPLGQPVNRGGVRVFYFRPTLGAKEAFYSRGLSLKLRETIGQFDLVYVVALWQWMGIETARLCAANRVPMVVATKGGFSRHLRKKSYLKKQLFRTLFLRKALSKASAIHLSGLAEKVSAGSWLDGEPVFYLPNPVDPKKYYPLPTAGVDFRHKFGIPRSSPVVISVGRPVWKKHVELLIGALKKEQDWFLIFVGDGRSGKAPQWKEHAERIGVASRVVWPGFLCGDELLAAFSASNLFALVSENENFGMVVVEAMMCGLPVLISKEVGVQEYIRDQPFVFTGDLSVEAVAEKLGTIERQLDDLQRRREEIRQCAIGQFAPERVAPSFACELRKLLPDHPRTTQVSCLKDNVVPDSEQRVR